MEIEEWRKMKKKSVVRQAHSQKVVICQKDGPKFMDSPLAGATPACKL